MNLGNFIFPCTPVKYLRIFIHRHYDVERAEGEIGEEFCEIIRI